MNKNVILILLKGFISAFTVILSGLASVTGADKMQTSSIPDFLKHFWFRMTEREADRDYHLYRVVNLQMLRYLPQEARHDAGLLDTMRNALKSASLPKWEGKR